jgi:segregation and condensation protein B
MSLKAKLEAVIYAAEEPVTLTQLAQLFAADALEWKAAQAAAAAELNADMAGEGLDSDERPPLMAEGLQSLAMADTAAMAIQAGQQAANAALVSDVVASAEPAPELSLTEAERVAASGDDGSSPESANEQEGLAAGQLVDAEAEARRLARQRDREIKAILKQILDELVAGSESDDRGVEIREIAGGYRMATKPECHDAVRLFIKSLKPPMRLSLPALETLAVVAYKQPVTAPEVSEIRGVESGGVLGSLLARKLIATAGRKQVIGRPILYKTTKEFLLRFGLKDLTELPSMEEFEKMAAAEIEEMEPEAVAADAAAEAADAAEDAEDAELDSNSPSGAELAESAEIAKAETVEAAPDGTDSTPEQTSEELTRGATDGTSAEPPHPSNEQNAERIKASAAPPAQPEAPAAAENEVTHDAEEVQEDH